MSGVRRPVTEVAVGVLVRPDGHVLLADRPPGKPYAGYWEFPGGKIEPGETVAAALARELFEELGVRIGPAAPWVCFEYSYPHAHVRLHFYRIDQWAGEPQPHEGQRLRFVDPQGDLPAPLLPAAIPTLRWLRLPAVIAPSAVAALGLDAFLARLERAIAAGLRAVLIDEPTLAPAGLAGCVKACALRLAAVGGAVVQMAAFDAESRDARPCRNAADPFAADLSARAVSLRPEEPPSASLPVWHGARAVGAAQIAHAARAGYDFALVGPVLRAPAPAEAPIGWPGFVATVRQAPIPVYADGGLQALDLAAARRHGAHGVVLDRDAWTDGAALRGRLLR